MSASELAVLETRVDLVDERLAYIEAREDKMTEWLLAIGLSLASFCLGVLVGLLIWTHSPWG